jgi:N-acyl-D-aspartate/D-glutamate deacylase
VLDLIIRGGRIVDGSGSPAIVGDVAVQGSRVVAVGHVDDTAARTFDAEGMVVAPGFVDIHTHFDAQAFWDPTLSPSPQHGVTSVFAGNCGFSIAPLSGDADDADYLLQMLARVEGMPVESLRAGVPWDWRSTADFFRRLEGRIVPNAGFLVGHSALRQTVMHEAAVQRAATASELAAMKELLRAGLAAGGMGFSSSWHRVHKDHLGGPVPSKVAPLEELLALCAVVREFPGTTVEFNGDVGRSEGRQGEIMGRMSHAADRIVNWNVLHANGQNRELVAQQLGASDVAAEFGGWAIALTMPDTLRGRMNFIHGTVLDTLPGWAPIMALPVAEKIAMLRDPAGRAEMDRLAQSEVSPVIGLTDWGDYCLEATATPEFDPFVGLRFSEIAEARGTSAWDALADVLVADKLQTLVFRAGVPESRAMWEHRAEVWRDPRAVVGASDAGAHYDMLDSFCYSTVLLAKGYREFGVVGLEEAVALLTGVPAALYGLTARGVLAEGAYADLVVFDPHTVAPGPVEIRRDLPAGAARLYRGALGIRDVLVNGVPVVHDDEYTGATPGTVLRSGDDTTTVRVPTAARKVEE